MPGYVAKRRYEYESRDGERVVREFPTGRQKRWLVIGGKRYDRVFSFIPSVAHRHQAVNQKDFDEGTRLQTKYFKAPAEINPYDEKKGRHLSDEEMVKQGRARTRACKREI